MSSTPHATIDFETRNVLSPSDVGAWAYSRNKAAQALCLRYHLPSWPRSQIGLWHRATAGIAESPPPQDLFDWIASGGLVEAHNSFFERCIWRNVMMPQHGWPRVPSRQWRCSAAKAAAMGLPRSLEELTKVLKTKHQKDMEGNRIMRKLSKPRRVLKKERKLLEAQGIDPDSLLLWHEDPADIRRNWDYCGTDVASEMDVSDMIRELSPVELETWFLDQEMNERGIRVDRPFVRGAMKIIEENRREADATIAALTGYEITKASSRAKIKDWLLEAHGLDMPDMQGETVDEYLEAGEMHEDAELALQLYRLVGRSSTAKFEMAWEMMDEEDDRVRDLVMFNGAHTGRWTGKLLQPHNFPRGIYSSKKKIGDVVEAITTGDSDYLRMLYGDPMAALANSLRGMFLASAGHKLYVGDFAAIEARVVFWISNAFGALKVFELKKDIYCELASQIYRRPITKADKNERQMGKQAILGLGFGMGFCKFLITLRKYNISLTEEQCRRIVPDYDELKYWLETKGAETVHRSGLNLQEDLPELVVTKYITDLYRKTYPEVVQFWDDLEAAAIAAVENPGMAFSAGKCKYMMVDGYLCCRLPSGRPLWYSSPRVTPTKTPWGQMKKTLSYMGKDAFTRQWSRIQTYGGKLCENVVQATARDLMRDSALRIDRHAHDMKFLLSVHDELVFEAPDEFDLDQHQFEQLMAQTEPWAAGCPVDVEGWVEHRYRK